MSQVVVQPQPQRKQAGLPLLDMSQSFWLLLALHGVIIAGELWLAYKAGWLKI